MSEPSNETPASDAAQASAATHAVRPFYWSVRRELWENRSIYLAPLVVAGVILLGFLVSSVRWSHAGLDMVSPQAAQIGLIEIPYAVGALAIVITAAIVGVFYCLGALHNERRDRSILFWKSLPVSDLTAVLAKAAVPLLVLPVVVFAVVVAMQLIMLILNTMSFLGRGLDLSLLWSNLPLLQIQGVLLYALAVLALWFAPVYAWLILVSGWAKRAPFLWAVLPPLVLSLLEKIAFNTDYVGSLISYRLHGFKAAFSEGTYAPSGQPEVIAHPLMLLDPGAFLRTPGLWTGLAVAAALLAAAVWVRRRREPI